MTLDARQPDRRAWRSWLTSALAILFFAWSALVLFTAASDRPWDPHSIFWQNSDALWAEMPAGNMPTPAELRLMHAQFDAQMRYELPIKGAILTWLVICFIVSPALLFRQNWARRIFIGLMVSGMLVVAFMHWVFASVELTRSWDWVTGLAIVAGLGAVGWWLRAPSVVREFMRRRDV